MRRFQIPANLISLPTEKLYSKQSPRSPRTHNYKSPVKKEGSAEQLQERLTLYDNTT